MYRFRNFSTSSPPSGYYNHHKREEVNVMIRMDIQTIVVGGGPVSSLVVLRTHTPYKGNTSVQLPIRIGSIEATAISLGAEGSSSTRPLTHDLLAATIRSLGATLEAINIVDVHGTTFYAELRLTRADGTSTRVDARPSDAIAIAVRQHVPIFAEEKVIDAASMPDFAAVEDAEKQQEMREFHEFVETLSPEDFS